MHAKKIDLEQFMTGLRKRNPGEHEFHQAVFEVAENLVPFINQNPQYLETRILERMTEPDRIVIFRVCWEDDGGNIRVNRGYRVQFNNSIGPYKGGLRFHPSVNLSILKFLGFEQTFKNSLTSLPMGAAKGGANFNPKGKSNREIMRFCQAFTTELSYYIGENIDVPAGDIGVGTQEISYMFGQYKRLTHEFTGTYTGKALEFGGSLIRKEATGYGAAYFMEEMLKHQGNTIEDKQVVISGSGNVAQYAAEKVFQLGGKVIALSDSSGYIHDREGLNPEKLAFLIHLKSIKRGRIREYAEHFGCEFVAGKRPWKIPCDLAFPCATQNEIEAEDAHRLVANGCIAVAEGANMPVTPQATRILHDAKILFAPGKASNAGGVAVSGLEMTQNSIRLSWEREELDSRLKEIMRQIHEKCVEFGAGADHVNYVKGANLAGFVKVAEAMLAYGII